MDHETFQNHHQSDIYNGTTPHPVTATTRIIPSLVGSPYKPSFVTVAGWAVDRIPEMTDRI